MEGGEPSSSPRRMTDDIEIERHGAWGVVTLRREKALNSLTKAMCAALDEALAEWAADDAVRAVLIEGAGDRAFCAGGDIRWLAETAKHDPAEAASFFRTEYRMNTRIHAFPKPYVALIDGICMGGGVGVSAGASHRIVTDRTMWAMPECGIGLIPDVGASFHLQAVPRAAALYLGLTGARLQGKDLIALGLADAMVPAERLPKLRDQLLALDLRGDAAARINAALPDQTGSVSSPVTQAASAFADATGIEDALARLAASPQPAEKAAAERLLAGSPTSLALTWRLLTEAPDAFEACIAREFRVAAHLMEGPDFLEGVRAQVIDKDRQPQWSPAELSAVTDAMLDRYFTTPQGGDLDLSGIAAAAPAPRGNA